MPFECKNKKNDLKWELLPQKIKTPSRDVDSQRISLLSDSSRLCLRTCLNTCSMDMYLIKHLKPPIS